jgi:hypothetical protein
VGAGLKIALGETKQLEQGEERLLSDIQDASECLICRAQRLEVRLKRSLGNHQVDQFTAEIHVGQFH